MGPERFGGFVSPAWFLLVMAVALSRSAAAIAADAGDAEALIREGVALRRAGSDVRALPLFQKAQEIAHTPRTAAQLGLVEFALGYSMDSEQHLAQGLAVPTDAWITKESGPARGHARPGEGDNR
ncbi:MAG TPA: hypothetical protein VH374_08730 [Polyangia bacterium]|jgi:hypothetical protein|nr:hypothetical protein [Polyangia bacterium]